MKRGLFVLAAASAIVAGSVLAAQNPPAAHRAARLRRQGGAPSSADGLLRHERRRWRRRKSRRPAGRRCALPEARGRIRPRGRGQQSLARLPEHAGSERRQRARSHRPGPVGERSRRRSWRAISRICTATRSSSRSSATTSARRTALTEKNTPIKGAGDLGRGRKAAQPARHSDRLDHGGPRVPGRRRSHLQQLDEQLHGQRPRSGTSIAPAAATRRGTRRTPARAAASRTSCRRAATATSTVSRRK